MAMDVHHPLVVADRPAPLAIPIVPCPLSFAIDASGRIGHPHGSLAIYFADLEGKSFGSAFSAMTPAPAPPSASAHVAHEGGSRVEIELRNGNTRLTGTLSGRGTAGATFIGDVTLLSSIRAAIPLNRRCD
jgi:hypothetical protein